MRVFRHLSVSANHPPKSLFRIRDNPVGASDGYFFVVDDGDGKGGVFPRTTNLTSQNFYCCIGGGYFVPSSSR